MSKNNLELTIYNATLVIDQLLKIDELSTLKEYYGVYSLKDCKMSMYDENKKPIIRPLKEKFEWDKSIKLGLEMVEELK